MDGEIYLLVELVAFVFEGERGSAHILLVGLHRALQALVPHIDTLSVLLDQSPTLLLGSVYLSEGSLSYLGVVEAAVALVPVFLLLASTESFLQLLRGLVGVAVNRITAESN